MNQLSDHFVEKAEDVVKEGEELEVKVLEVDAQGRINLSRKAVTHPGSENEPRREGAGTGGGYRGGRERDSHGGRGFGGRDRGGPRR
jgi:polyribonucleotide nucleotidyltransferase